MLYNENHRQSSEESAPLALALFDRPESDVKAIKPEKTAVALGEYWQVATVTPQGKLVLCNSCVRAASLKVTISQGRTSHLYRDQVRCKYTSLIHKSIITIPGIALGRAPIAFPCKEYETCRNCLFLLPFFYKIMSRNSLRYVFFDSAHATLDQLGWIHPQKTLNSWCLAHTKSQSHPQIRCSSAFLTCRT